MEIEPESTKIFSFRQKIHSKMDELEKIVTNEELAKKIDQISSRISSNDNRADIKKNNFSIFDENSSSVEVSKKVSEVFVKIPFNQNLTN